MSLSNQIKNALEFLAPPKINVLNKLNDIRLRKITIPSVSVNGNSFINLEHMTSNVSWTHVFGASPELEPVRNAMKSFVKISKTYQEKFDFKTIDSFSASKSFMTFSEKTNVSKYKNALDWGLHMWEDDNLAFTTDEDFQKNITHLQGEGIGSSGEIPVYTYAWHQDRILWGNSGGSHHAAALIRQMHTQNREFFCKAKIIHYSIDNEVFAPVLEDFYLLVVDDNCFMGEDYYLGLALSDLDILFTTCNLPIPDRSYHLLVIPKKQSAISSSDLAKWVTKNLRSNTMLNFTELFSDNEEAKHSAQELDTKAS